MRNNYKKDIGKGSINDPYPIEKKKSYFTTILLTGLLVFIAGSIGYDYMKTHNLFESQNTEKLGQHFAKEDVVLDSSKVEDNIGISTTLQSERIRTAPPKNKQTSESQSKEDVSDFTPPGSNPKPVTIEATSRPKSASVTPQASRLNTTQSPRNVDYSELPNSEFLDRKIHEQTIKRAREAGVSTEGSTSEILDRITRKNLEKYGY